MFALSVAATILSDLTTAGQSSPTTPQSGEGFLQLLNAGSGNTDALFAPDNADPANGAGNSNSQSPTNNAPETSVNVPTSIFADNSQHAHLFTPASSSNPPPPKNASSSNNNQTQNAPTPSSSAPVLKASSSSTSNQNANASASDQSSAQPATGQGTGTAQTAKQLRMQIGDQLDNISQILLSMMQALSAAAPQTPVTPNTDTTATSSSQTGATGNDLAGSAANDSSTTGTPANQETALLKDMQALLQQLQQALQGQDQSQGQDQNGQDNLQTLSDSLLSDMSKFSQLVNPPSASADNTASSTSLFNTPQFQDLSNLLKSSITQTQNQLQTLQASNDAMFAQAQANVQAPPADVTSQSKTAQDNNSLSANNTQAAGNIPPAPATPDVTVKAATDSLLFSAAPVVAGASQGGGNSAGNNNQDSNQNQNAQPVVAAATSSAAPSNSAGGASFDRVLSQVSQSDVLDQVQVQVKTALGDGSSKISIQLNPPDLGKVDVKLEVSADGKTNGVTITATNQSTLDLLQRDTQGLTRALNDAGLTTDSGSLSFNLSGGGQQNQTQGNNQQAAITYQQAQPEEEEPNISTISRSYAVNLAGGLDITI